MVFKMAANPGTATNRALIHMSNGDDHARPAFWVTGPNRGAGVANKMEWFSSSNGSSNFLDSENDTTSSALSSVSNMFDLDDYKPQFSNGKLWDATIRLGADAKYEDSNWTIESPNMTINGGINLTNNWVLTYSGSYDFDRGTITIPTFNLSRDLHCWNFNFMWRPSGYSKGFRLKINLKNPDLQDIKVRSTSSNFRD